MTDATPIPGQGYKILEYIGGGFWKRAYRASSDFITADVALLYFRDESRKEIIAKDVSNLLRATSGHTYSSYLANFYGIQRGDDGKWFIVEELLERSLEGLYPLNDLVMFSRIARDLCRGLTCLHDNGLVHRDLKLDNCGLDRLQKAKIFDLGSVTSEPGGVEGTILTRAPELFSFNNGDELFVSSNVAAAGQDRMSFPSDVWALGATLFALVTGKYPFVHQNEIAARRKINAKVVKGILSSELAIKEKEKIDRKIAERVRHTKAFDVLKERVHTSLRGRAEKTLNFMLNSDPDNRGTANELAMQWTDLCNELGGARSEPMKDVNKWDRILRQLTAIENREYALTRNQLERLIAELINAQKEIDSDTFEKIDETLRRIKHEILEDSVSAA